ncbi:hypothetical protein [Massilia sp. ST3]|uniref:hypothetical protein n=1 Tax=Massilia sp. ST3 TaxID=2824903 RepID=UPI001B840B6C|nr:hypothetical protein [Massilia sp. ST3]MBQ5950095.1 hypothetical protein [Massilia sp. ST3]
MSPTIGNAPLRPVTAGLLRVVLATACLLLVPLVAMQFTREVNWTGSDFVVAGILLGGTGCAWVLLSRLVRAPRERKLLGLVLLGALLVTWAELAVGIFH